MQTDSHKLIAMRSVEYADTMCDGDDERKFCRGSIAAAYIIGAEETLHRICEIIKFSAQIGGITDRQSLSLLFAIEEIESMADE